MSIRDRLIEIVGGKQYKDEVAKTQEAFNTLYESYLDGPFRIPPQMVAERLSELDSSTVLYLLRSMQSNSITGLPYTADTESQREYQVMESRQQWLYSPLASWSVNVWTSYGLGEKVTITCNDKKAQVVWDSVWDKSALFDDDNIHMLSSSVLVDGDVYMAAFISIADGSVSFEYIGTDEIKEIVTNPDNRNQALYYRREYTGTDNATRCIYYPDWHAYFYSQEDLKKAALPSDAIVSISEAMDDNAGTSVLILHIAHNRKDASSLHGWPILGIAAPYFRAHKEFVENRLTVSRQKAMFVREFISAGGSRGVAAVKAKFGQQLSTSTGYTTTDANPPAVSGSNLIHNQAVEHRDLPMTTGASDAKGDNEMFGWMALIGAGLFPTTAGMDTSRWATALAMDKTQAVQWSRYQSFWSAQFRKMVEIVLLAAETWGGQSFEDKGCQVSIDTLSLVDFPGVVPPIAQMLGTMPSMIADGTLNQNAARELLQAMWQPVLTALGTEDIDEILSDDMLGIVEPENAEKVNNAMREFARQIMKQRLIKEANQHETNKRGKDKLYGQKIAEKAGNQ